MDIVEQLQQGEQIGDPRWQLEIEDNGCVAVAFRADDAGEFRPVQSVGLPQWFHFAPLSDEQRRLLDLDEGRWVVGMRRRLAGKTLDQIADRGGDRWGQWAADLAYIFQNVHAQKMVHGALEPSQVIVGRNQRAQLVGVGPTAPGPEAPSAGDPMFVAPELTDGDQSPKRAADVYALAALICWMGADGELTMVPAGDQPGMGDPDRQIPAVPDGIDDPVATLVQRAFLAAPEARPSVADFYEALAALPGVKPRRFVALPARLYTGLERKVADAVDRGESMVLLEGEGATGKTFAMRRLKTRLQWEGRNTVYASPDRIEGPSPGQVAETSLEWGPWEPVRRLVAALAGEDAEELFDQDEDTIRRGDTLWQARRWLARLREALPDGQTVVLWDDYDVTAPDVRWFWEYAMEQLEAFQDGRLRLVAASEPGGRWLQQGARFEIQGPGRRAWNGWRQRTPVSQVRQISNERWKILVDRHGSRPVELFEAINQELDVRESPEFARRRPATRAVPSAAALFAGDWRRHLNELLDRGACVQAGQTCEQLYQILTRSHPDKRLQVLQFWMRAVEGTGYQPEMVDRLDQALGETAETEQSRVQALLLRGRLYGRVHRFEEAMSTLEQPGDLEGPARVQQLRFGAEVLAAQGRFDEVRQMAGRGLQLHDEESAGPRVGLHLEALQAAGRATAGDQEAIGELRRLAGEAEQFKQAVGLQAFCHRMRGLALGKAGRWTDAVQAYLRALEVMETAGLAGQLAPYLMDVGRAQRRRGRPGMAREYLARAKSLVHRGTPADVARRLAYETASLELLFRRVDQARELVERFGPKSGGQLEGPQAGRWAALCAGICRADEQLQQAADWYDRALRRAPEESRLQVQMLVGRADLAIDVGDQARARRLLQKTSAIAERVGDDHLEELLNLVRARLQFTEGDELEQVGAGERLRLQLEDAVDRGRAELVLKWVPRLWPLLEQKADSQTVEIAADAYHRARQEATRGISETRRRRLLASLPELPRPDEIEPQEQPEPAEQREPGESELIEENERLRRQLQQRDEEIEQLRGQIEQLQRQLDEQTGGPSSKSSRRGRRPKAKRDDVIDALEGADGDVDAAAESLGVSTRTLYRYLNRYGIER